MSREADLVLRLPSENVLPPLGAGDLDPSRETLLCLLCLPSSLSLTLVSDLLLVKSFLTFLIRSGVGAALGADSNDLDWLSSERYNGNTPDGFEAKICNEMFEKVELRMLRVFVQCDANSIEC